jgi:hypothetical protein
MVTNQILIEHFSSGVINGDWVESTYYMHNICNNILPLSLGQYKVRRSLEVANSKKFICRCLKFKKIKLAYSSGLKLLCLNPFSLFDFKFLVQNCYYLICKK